ncbi:hypothetical protein DENIS_4956 [Desulfonema ishimotonii]|uniref:Uncharacterized protein n=1 Tax=Desulfonema ishimotonii TaxID=45657 RepID=A0A401G408_9BACT|nr:hypothetical protein DENIS_4956 [Desulfonema ishimotonii]
MGRDFAIQVRRHTVVRFNPRARMGRDFPTNLQLSRRYVSIHAPAWGATLKKAGARWQKKGFNPRARMGRDTIRNSVPGDQHGFNPRARMGRDKYRLELHRFGSVSIHAPAWGAT